MLEAHLDPKSDAASRRPETIDRMVGWILDRLGLQAGDRVLEEGFDYPEEKIFLDQYVVIDADGTLRVYRNWFQDYAPAMLTAELEAGGGYPRGAVGGPDRDAVNRRFGMDWRGGQGESAID
jgi:hypothetical protein